MIKRFFSPVPEWRFTNSIHVVFQLSLRKVVQVARRSRAGKAFTSQTHREFRDFFQLPPVPRHLGRSSSLTISASGGDGFETAA
jgi:hypothetical protein